MSTRHGVATRGSGRARRGPVMLGLLVACVVWPPALLSQERSAEAGSARIVAFTNEPREPELGEVFELEVQLRVAPGVVAFLSDTMTDAASAVSAGAGSWTVTAGPGDSLDVRATYPVMGFLPGGVELPFVEMWTRSVQSGEDAGVRPSTELPVAERGSDEVEHALLYLGGIFVMPPSAMVGDDAAIEPRPPADVVGGERSPWLVAAMAVGAGALGVVIWLLLSGRSAGAGTLSPLLSPREDALAQLDRIRSLGWHTNGRIVDFYDATTGVLRQYAERRRPREWRTALTSSELLARLAEGHASDAVADLRPTVWTAECVKFGSRRPDAETAEEDWSHVRDWIEREADES